MKCRAPVAGVLLAMVVARIASAEVVGSISRSGLMRAGRAADRACLLCGRSAASRQSGHRGPRCSLRQNGAGLVEFSSALLVPAQGRAPRKWHGLLRDRESRPRSVARSDERRPVSRRVGRGVGPRRPFHGRPGIHDGVSRMAVRRRARAGPRVASAVGASRGAGSGQCVEGGTRGRPGPSVLRIARSGTPP